MLYEKIKSLALIKQVSIAEMEREIGLGHGTIRKWKNSQPTINKAKLVADYFGISLDELVSKQ